MSLKDIAKNKLKNKTRKIVFKIIKPFIPFILIFVGIVLVISLVIDGLFVTEADMSLVEKAEKGELSDMEYMDWLKSRAESTTIVNKNNGLIPKGMFIWPIPGYATITSNFGMRVHPITRCL